ncbi:glycosyltransferase [Microbacterium marinilacus]|uniref:Glycosyltransferase n=1 Tax=Microbacterium marinilacus TaxID=415209 RepID=A0ABP7BQU0_9MICO|nr:glycosyltransferase [Microbacterium marinilacus]MBY0690065.1 glycosyltransferase [Microbacterium marinilacus]
MSRPLVVVSLEPWDEVRRRNQYLVGGLLDADVARTALFVEPPADPLYELRSGRRPRLASGLRTSQAYGGRLRLLEPVKSLPRAVGPLADRILHDQVRRAVDRLGWRDPILWVNDPRWWGLAARTGWDTVYDITDDWTRADRAPREHARLVAGDEALLALSARVVVCSTGLAETKRASRPVTLIPNAVDVARYRRPLPRPGDLPEGPVALYLGTLHEDRLDVGLLQRTAARVAGAGGTVVLVGPDALSARHGELLRATPGLLLLGARAWDAVPAYLQHAQALIVPHLVSPFTDSLDPIKAYEYLAVGRPVVATPVAGFRERAGRRGVTVVPATGFPGAVAGALGTSAEGAREQVPDWSQRVADYDALLRGLGSPGGDG